MISLRMLSISRNATPPPRTGETTQLAAIWAILPQLTASMPMPAMAKPTMAPTMEWVVETGQPRADANASQQPAASKAASMPNTSSSGLSAICDGSTMPLRMVRVTLPPASAAPANSNTAATMIAVVTVIAPEPTEVPSALATSLAPMPQVMKTPKAMPRISSVEP